ncbi:MAG TPA: Panacea domain-containing protein [Candidatus Paceibacterota bacterium]
MPTNGAILSNTLNTEQYKNAILYFVKYCNNDLLGKTKLYKLLYYLDFISYRDTGKSVTGDIYIKQEYGPIPSRVDEVLAELKNSGSINTDIVSSGPKDRVQFSLGAGASLDESVFTAQQKELLENICKEFAGWTREKIVNQTHLEAPWFFSKPYDVVDYSYAKDIDFFVK